MILASCSNSTGSGSHTWFYIEQNYTAILNESHASSLLVSVAYDVQPQLLLWKRNGSTLNLDTSPRISIPELGMLIFNEVQLSDAGYYTLTATNGAQCQSKQILVLVECM